MQKVEGMISSIGIMAGTIMITPAGGGFDVTVKVSENQKQKMLPRLNVGDHVTVNYDESTGFIKGGIDVTKQNTPQTKPMNVYPTKQEKAWLDQGNKENAILWQSCMKIAIEVEKFFATGGAEDRDTTCKKIVESTDFLYEASQKKLRGVPPLQEPPKV